MFYSQVYMLSLCTKYRSVLSFSICIARHSSYAGVLMVVTHINHKLTFKYTDQIRILSQFNDVGLPGWLLMQTLNIKCRVFFLAR